MKKGFIKLFAFTAFTAAMLTFPSFAKNEKIDIFQEDTVEYTIEKEKSLDGKIFIDEDGVLSLQITDMTTDTGAVPKLGITINDGKNSLYFETEKPFDPERAKILQGFAEGEYPVRIDNLSRFASVSFKLETSLTPSDYTEKLGNKDFDSASELITGKKYTGGIINENDADFYFFDMPYDGYAFISFYSPDIKFFTLYDENKNEIGFLDIKIDDPKLVYEQRTGLKKGKYYIKATPDYDCTTPVYTLEVQPYKADNFEGEYNNMKETAENIILGKEYFGNMFGISDEDAYAFTLENDSHVKIRFKDTHLTNNGHYSIWLSDGKKEIKSVDKCGTVTLDADLEKGTYYFTVSSLGNKYFTGMGYTVKISAEKSSLEAENDTDVSEPEDDKDAWFATDAVIPFADVDSTAWYAEYLETARNRGLIVGLEGNRYAPLNNVTVAEAITMTVRDYVSFHGHEFDIHPKEGEKWYQPYVDYAIKKGWISDSDFDSFERTAKRNEMAFLFASSLKSTLNGTDTSDIEIPDVDENTKHADSIKLLYKAGLLSGNDEKGTYYPDKEITRAEAAVILLRINLFKEEISNIGYEG